MARDKWNSQQTTSASMEYAFNVYFHIFFFSFPSFVSPISSHSFHFLSFFLSFCGFVYFIYIYLYNINESYWLSRFKCCFILVALFQCWFFHSFSCQFIFKSPVSKLSESLIQELNCCIRKYLPYGLTLMFYVKCMVVEELRNVDCGIQLFIVNWNIRYEQDVELNISKTVKMNHMQFWI